jgi:hypothetical protein
MTLAHLFGDTLVSDAALTFSFRCKADLPPVVEPFYFGFISANSKAAGVVNEWSPWRTFAAQDLADSRVSEEIAPGVFKLRLYVSNVDPTRVTPVHMQIVKQSGSNITLHSDLIGGTFGLFVSCADTVSCGAFAPVYFTYAQYEKFRYFDRMPTAKTPPIKFPLIGRFIGGSGGLDEWRGGVAALRRTGYTIIHLPATNGLGALPREFGDERFGDGVCVKHRMNSCCQLTHTLDSPTHTRPMIYAACRYSPPGGAFAQGPSWYGIWWALENWAQTKATNYAAAGFNVSGLRGFALADEPGFYQPAAFTSSWGERQQADFVDYLKHNVSLPQFEPLTPALLGAASWTNVTPVGRSAASISLPLKRRFYHTSRFLAAYSAKFFAMATEAMERAFGPETTTFSNWSVQRSLSAAARRDPPPPLDSSSHDTDFLSHIGSPLQE